ncbi:MAG: hypothetical protein R3194_00230 [Limnobacter sp.]|nr:hypothetical protein [Limnobacter sp.]
MKITKSFVFTVYLLNVPCAFIPNPLIKPVLSEGPSTAPAFDDAIFMFTSTETPLADNGTQIGASGVNFVWSTHDIF